MPIRCLAETQRQVQGKLDVPAEPTTRNHDRRRARTDITIGQALLTNLEYQHVLDNLCKRNETRHKVKTDETRSITHKQA